MKNLVSNSVLNLIALFNSLLSASFVGVKEYTSKTSGEIANFVINCGISYRNAVLSDIQTLKGVGEYQINEIYEYCTKNFPEKNISKLLVIQAIEKLLNGFEKNLNKETASNQSLAQQDAYININSSVRLNKETELFYIYGFVVYKKRIKDGEYKTVNSAPLTVAQGATKKVLNLRTAKFRNFIVTPEHLGKVNAKGESYEIV